MQIPNDPNMLLSYVNLKLRDFYPSLEAMCDDLALDKEEIVRKLNGIGYIYNDDRNQFI